jgi:hypothetical protein
MNYDVGQVLYLLARQSNKVVSCRVESVTTTQTLDGTNVTHELSTPTEEGVPNTKLIPLEKLQVDVFTSVEKLRSAMIDKVTVAIDKDLDHAMEIAKMVYGEKPVSQAKVNMPINEDAVRVEMPNGVTARVTLPKELS